MNHNLRIGRNQLGEFGGAALGWHLPSGYECDIYPFGSKESKTWFIEEGEAAAAGPLLSIIAIWRVKSKQQKA